MTLLTGGFVLGPVGLDLTPEPLVIGVVVVAGPHDRLRRLRVQGKASPRWLVEHL